MAMSVRSTIASMATVNLERSTGTCTSVSSAGSLILYPGAKLDHLPGPQIPNSKFPTLFGGIGQLKDVTVRRVPFHIRQQVEEEIKNLASKEIIEKVDSPTPWVSPLVVITKTNGDVRISVDMRLANKAII